LLYTSGN
jgi:Tfp pilus assembly protein PilN